MAQAVFSLFLFKCTPIEAVRREPSGKGSGYLEAVRREPSGEGSGYLEAVRREPSGEGSGYLEAVRREPSGEEQNHAQSLHLDSCIANITYHHRRACALPLLKAPEGLRPTAFKVTGGLAPYRF